jgi:hypothetical protein
VDVDRSVLVFGGGGLSWVIYLLFLLGKKVKIKITVRKSEFQKGSWFMGSLKK